MRRSTMTALASSVGVAAFALTGCSHSAEPAGASPASSAPAQRGGRASSPPAPLSSSDLHQRLLTESELDEGYTRKPEALRRNDVTVIGCPALEKLGSGAATGSGLAFPRKAKVSFTYTGSSSSELGEELYSDSPAKLSQGIGKVFDAMLSCRSFQVASGSSVIDVGTERASVPDLADERWSQLMTFSARGQRRIVKQTAVRTGNLLVILSGSPGLVDAHLAEAVGKAQRTR
ncbi:hypothetical protein QIS99_29050 [Streptomyces sp. B-S-A8]|uniref:Secreted protein n=1 Tax=Streptomyces solicavernae TaxID=3043614 RepID=A0ABT6S0J7_9ACTN|nr:hypothetical protein [Streptomyces sp. B-S-A8]MDI3390209.1 hypothetical protein [Streptomyces sp. B-S-A8]